MSDMPATAIEHFMQRDFVLVREKASTAEGRRSDNQNPVHIQVGEVMIQPLIAIAINRTVHDASGLMTEKWIRHLPGTENGIIVGILSVRDLIRMVALRDRPRFLRQK